MSNVTRQPGFTDRDPATIAALRTAAELVEAGETDMERAILSARGYDKPADDAPLTLRGLYLMRRDHCAVVRALRQYLRYLHRDDTADARLLRDIADIIEGWQGVWIETTTTEVNGLRVKRREEVRA